MPPPRLPKVSGELGDGPVEDFFAEPERIIAAYDLEGRLAVELLLKHLDGQARREVLAQAPAARAIAGDVLGLLREAFGDQRPLTQLLTAFHCRQQRPAETVLEFATPSKSWPPGSPAGTQSPFHPALSEIGSARGWQKWPSRGNCAG